MSPDCYPSKRLSSALAATALAGALGLAATGARAAPTTAAQCAAASKSAVSLTANHKLRQARDQAQICVAASCSATVRAACKKRLATLGAAIPTIAFAAKDSAGHDLSDVTVSMDGESLADHLDGTALSADPGAHTFTFQVAGQPSMDQSFVLTEGQKNRHETVTFPAPPPPPAPAPVATAPPSSTDADTGASGSSHGPLRTVAFVVGGIGIAGLVVGGVTGALALSKSNASQSACGSASDCPQHSASVSDYNSASSLSTVSTIAFVGGGVALAAGVTFFLLSPRRGEASPAPATAFRVDPVVGVNTGGVTFKGVF
jgi:hypothetical protein